MEPCGLPDQHHPEKDADYEGDSVEIVDTDSCKDQQPAQTTPGEASGWIGFIIFVSMLKVTKIII